MISKHIDLFAVLFLLLGILVWSEVRQSVLLQMVKVPARVRVKQISVHMPQPPVMPVVFK
jgi:hypothetical protein